MSDANNSKPVLIIEDIDSISKLFTILLKKVGLSTVIFETGEEACEWLDSNIPSVVICDIMLPTMNGEDFLKHIRSIPKLSNIPVLAVTALALEGDKERLLAYGFDDYISKPIDNTSFVQTIQRYSKQ